MSSRLGLRFLHASRQTLRPCQTKQQLVRRNLGRRWQSTDAAAPAAEQSGFAKIWNSPIGPKTVHFWAPVMKWGLVIAGISDFARPAEKLSLTQNVALMCTGAIWTRWCLIIKPRNVLLATVNFFLGCVGVTQVSRIFMYRRSVEGQSAVEAAKDVAIDMKETAVDAAKDGAAKVKSAVQ
ncbi:hypothetical protein MMC10_004468 [Thelotrema lepadinum]|nr:hypothetical protein [Thelotrema lepadinum]